MRTVKLWMIGWSCLALGLLSALAGCGGGGMSLIAISPSTPQSLDAGQTLTITASVVNDSSQYGAKFSLSGPGTLSSETLAPKGDSEFITVTYTAPSNITSTATAIVTATSLNTPSQSASVTITINPALAITTTTLPSGTVPTPYTTTLTSTGGTGTVKWSLASGTLPTGLALSALTGVISGTPTVAGTYTFTIGVTDSATTPNTVTQAYSLTINPQPPTIAPVTLPNAVAGTAYSQQLAYTGGTGTPTWAITTGSLPAGLTLSAAGLISGTPTNASAGATYTFTVTVTTGTQTSAPVVFSITVPALPVVTTTSLPSGNIGIAYSQQLTYSGGAGGTVTWAIVSGSLPGTSGLTLSTSGLLSGKPTTATTYTFSVTVTVGTQTSAAQALTLVINSLIVTSGATATGEAGLAFGFHLTAAGGTAPYTWSLASGSTALPNGLNLNTSTGYISGSPTTATGSPFTGIVVQTKDSLAATATQTMTFTINAARGNTKNSELSGQYAFLLSGFDANGKPLTTAGKFVADGNGNITGGVMDVNGTGLAAPQSNAALTATTYSVGTDNRGKLTLTTAAGTAAYVISVDTITTGIASAGYLTEFDSTGQSRAGVFALQTPTAFTTASIAGGFAYGLDGFAANSSSAQLQHRAEIGELQFNGAGNITSAEFLSTASGSTTPTLPNSAALIIGSNGRGTLALTLPGGATLNFAVYVVSASKLYLISSDPASGTTGANDLLFGQSMQQTTLNGNFNAASLNAISVLRSQKLDVTTGGVYYPDVQLALYTFSGAGKVSVTGDENAGGTVTTTSLSGTYTVAANGRVALSLSSAGIGGCTDCVTLQTYFYLVGANQGFALDFSTPATSGYFEPQTATGFSAASFSGAYALGSIDPLAQSTGYNTGVITATGAGSLSGTIDQNSDGSLNPDNAVTDTYAVGATGRVVITQTGSSPVLYIVSATKGLLLDLSSTTPVIEEVAHQ